MQRDAEWNEEEVRLGEIRAGQAMEDLVQHPSWKLYVKVLEQRIRDKEMLVARPVTSMEDALSQNAEKGSIAGLRLAVSIPDDTIAHMKVRLREQQSKMEEDEDEDRS